MKKVIITEKVRGLLFRNGKYIKTLMPGKYYIYGGREIEETSVETAISSDFCSLNTLLNDPDFAKAVTVAEVGNKQLAIHFVNGQYEEMLKPGIYAFWSEPEQHTFRMVDVSTPEVDADFPEEIFAKLPPSWFTKVEVAEHQKARLYFNQKFVRLLDAGTYYFWTFSTKVHTRMVDTRLTQMDITGQEILTRDKVSVRINFVCRYRVTDCIRIAEIDDFAEQLHVAAQLALREYVGKYRLDDLLESKEELSRFVFDRLKAGEQTMFVEIADAGVKDIILPGEIRDIMNTVLVAEKRAQANVIARREEVASTRSLLNTAKLMDENQTLYKLKELECIERICENVGTIQLNGSGDVLSQLTSLLQKRG